MPQSTHRRKKIGGHQPVTLGVASVREQHCADATLRAAMFVELRSTSLRRFCCDRNNDFDDARLRLGKLLKTPDRPLGSGDSGDGAAVREADRPSMVSPPASRAECGTASRAEA